VLHLKLDGCLYVSKLRLDEFRVAIALSMVRGEDIVRLLAPILGDEPARAFWNKAKELLL
jgi:hypothetical protein